MRATALRTSQHKLPTLWWRDISARGCTDTWRRCSHTAPARLNSPGLLSRVWQALDRSEGAEGRPDPDLILVSLKSPFSGLPFQASCCSVLVPSPLPNSLRDLRILTSVGSGSESKRETEVFATSPPQTSHLLPFLRRSMTGAFSEDAPGL